PLHKAKLTRHLPRSAAKTIDWNFSGSRRRRRRRLASGTELEYLISEHSLSYGNTPSGCMLKCDVTIVGTPCTNCQKANRLDCSAHEKKRRTGAGRGSFPGMLPPGDYSSNSDPTASNAYSSSSPNGPVYPPPQAPNPQQAPPPVSDPLTGMIYQTRPARIADLPAINRKEEDFTYLGSDLSNIAFIARATGQDVHTHHVPTKSLRQVTNTSRQVPAEVLQLPDKPLVDQLLQTYFSYINPIFPVVDERLFMAQYHRQGPMDPAGPPSLLLLQAMLAATSQISYENKQERESMKAMFFHRSKVLIDSRYERNQDVVVQSCLLLAYTGGSLTEGDAYFWARYAATIAFDLGMHRDGEKSALSAHTKLTRRRVFWLLFAVDTTTMLRGRPAAISLEDCDVQELRAKDFENCGQNTHIDLVLHTVQLSVIVSRAIRTCLRPRIQTEQRKQALQNADTELGQWSLQTPQHLQIGQTPEVSLQSAILHLAYNHAVLLLHRTNSTSEATPEDSAKCNAAATHIQTAAEQLGKQGLLKYLPNSVTEACAAALIQLQNESGQAQPRVDSLHISLRILGDHWPQIEPDLSVLWQALVSVPVKQEHDQAKPAEVPTTTAPAPSASMLDPALSGPPAGQGVYQSELPFP
ncbi:acetamidase regulatory protein, partial [Teratosphaeria destructans]